MQYQRAVCKALQDRVPDEKASMITTVSDPVIGVFAISLILFVMYIMHLIWYLIKCNVLGKQRFTSLYFSCGQVLMVVGAGRGPLVRASLQVHFSTCCLIGFGYTMSLDCILHVENYIV